MPHARPPRPTRLTAHAALTHVRRLQNARSARDRGGLHFIEGVRNLTHAFDRGITFDHLIVSKRLLQSVVAQVLVRKLRARGVPCVTMTPEQFRGVSQTQRASGVGAVVRQHWSGLEDMSAHQGLCWLALESVRSPGNLGTLVRSCAAVGAAGLILIGPQVDPFHPAVVRASMGALFGQRLVRCGGREFSQWVSTQGCRVIGASPDGQADYHQAAFSRPTVLMLGDEREGLSPAQREMCDATVRIPMAAECDSLNLGVAGSLLLYEAYRQHQ